MLKIIRHLFLVLSATACVTTACTDWEKEQEDYSLHFDFKVVSDSRVQTKGQISVADETIGDIELFIFDSEYGALIQHLNFSAGNDYRSDIIQRGRRYVVYALANCNFEEEPSGIEQLKEMSVNMESLSGISSRGIPMAGVSDEFKFDDKMSSVSIPLKRLMSKVILKIDSESMNGCLTIKGVTLHNAPSRVFPFSESSKISQDEAKDGDIASQDDIDRLNSGKSIVLMVGENMQGTLLEGNEDPWMKTPENIPDKHNCCTYITVEGDYCNKGLSISDVCYNMYLGENSTTNFDICRNCIYDLTLSISDEATVLASSWKVERGTIIKINYDQPLVMWRGDTLKLTATALCEPDFTTEDITSQAIWSTVGNAGKFVASSGCNPALFVAENLGTDTITASWYGKKCSIKAIVSTTDHVFVEPRDTTIHVGDSVVLRGHVVFASGDTLYCPHEFDYLIKYKGIFRKVFGQPTIYAVSPGSEHPACILKKDSFLDTTACLITVLP